MYTVVDTPARVSNWHAVQPNETRLPVNVSEFELIERCKDGDEAAWNLLVLRYERTIYKFAYRMCRNYDESADLVGDVLLKVYQHLHTFRNESSFCSWLYRITRNSFLDMHVRPAYCKFEGSTTVTTDIDGQCAVLDIADPHPSPEQICVGDDVIEVLSRAMNELPAYVRQPLKMRAQGASYAQIAEVTGVNMGTVKSRLSRGRHMLHERLPILDELLMAH